jgi:hypothetical protein
VQLGLYCSIPGSKPSGSSVTVPCAGGIAQDFPALGTAIGAVTPLTLVVSLGNNDALEGVTFSGGGTAVTGALGSLVLTNPSPTSLVIASSGGTAPATYATTTANGSASAFSLFPPTPTGWTLSDSGHDMQIEVTVTDDTTRNLTATITTISTGVTLATGTLDKSGTGSITFSDGTVETVTSWTLAD